MLRPAALLLFLPAAAAHDACTCTEYRNGASASSPELCQDGSICYPTQGTDPQACNPSWSPCTPSGTPPAPPVTPPPPPPATPTPPAPTPVPPSPTPPPSPPPTPPGPTPPSPSGCPGGSLSDCIALCPQSPDSAFEACAKNCQKRCAGPSPPAPTPPTPPAPTPPTPAPSSCPGGTLAACIALCPQSPDAAFEACAKNCQKRCGGPPPPPLAVNA